MEQELNKIRDALAALNLGEIYYGVYPTDDTTTDHVVLTPVDVETVTETDNRRYWLRYMTSVDIFTKSSTIFSRARRAAQALENAGFFIESMNYFIDDKTKLHQMSINVSSSGYSHGG